jgi:hypothetical protein
VLSFSLSLWIGVVPVAAAQDASAPQGSLETARELIKNGDYDQAIEQLRGSIERERGNPEHQSEAYLLLIKTYVFLGNDYKFRPQGREMSNLNYRAARELITQVLSIPELRHLRPEPASEYPPEMITMFAEVRSEKFGSFRVVRLEPEDAAVTFDGAPLGSTPNDPMPGDTDLPVGKHVVRVTAPGHVEVTDEVTISPNSTLERSYQLTKRRGTWWYATRGAALALVVGTVAVLANRTTDEDLGPEDLPGAPPPPSP